MNSLYSVFSEYILDEYLKKGILKPDGILVYPVIFSEAVELAKSLNQRNLKGIFILTNIESDEALLELGMEIIHIPALDITDSVEMAKDIALEYENSVLLNPLEDKMVVSAYFKYGKKLLDSDIDVLIVPYISGAILTGFAKAMKLLNEDSYVIGIPIKQSETKLLDMDFIDEIQIKSIDTVKKQYEDKKIYIVETVL